MLNTLEIFVSYSHKDEGLCKELESHLAFLKRNGNFIWHDRMIPAGSEWEGMIDDHLNSAHIILLLISSDFLDSRYCFDIEFQQAMKRHNAQDAVVIPVILREVFWEWGELADLQALPRDNKAVMSDYWKGNKDAAFRHVAEGIRRVAEELTAKSFAKTIGKRQAHNSTKRAKDSNELYNALLTLNYKQQMLLFHRFVESDHRIGAFLIHGEPECGQIWLLHRAMKQIPDSTRCKIFPFNFRRMGRGRYLDALWCELGQWIGITSFYSPQKVAEQVHELWQTQSVVLILRNISVVDEEYMRKLLQDFWFPLVEKTRQLPCKGKNYLLMFLIDEEDCVDRWNLPLASQVDRGWQPSALIKLAKVTPFPKEVINSWVEHEMDTLPTDIDIQDILGNSEGGLPELVLSRICIQCGYDWYERGKVWMKY